MVPSFGKVQKARKEQAEDRAVQDATDAQAPGPPAASGGPPAVPPAAEQAVPVLDVDDVDLDDVKQLWSGCNANIDMPAEAGEANFRARAKRLRASFQALRAKKKPRAQ